MILKFSIYRYHPELNITPYMQDHLLEIKDGEDIMLLDALILLKENDPTLTFRYSCREGVCGSDGLNINGKNGLACITPVSTLIHKNKKIIIRPLPLLPVVRDLVVDMKPFYLQYEKVQPYLCHDSTIMPEKEHLQTPEQRNKIDGSYECILCACCSTACPSFWWNPDKFLGPASLITSYRFLIDNRDTETNNRLDNLSDAFSAFRCRGIMNCTQVCPKGLNPAEAIGRIKSKLLQRDA
ncbi:Succinate dehydrogenase iron-sulfur subunit [Candidatus Erwinia haradaeae]|uniref:Succinate dehydrogenase iron-sulfur subunit n=1 Tax=Candidatus Erwinia haradaeae TaxID=1922217 RepID=A0A451D0B6_9GAMM|nr:succinate dehydrogenase iron-sulfur subunit [Candidatus Erwinia haradaeae]VFP78995.1 Succinate dehydrogenase iron-sulfur subunit [Candidatus Erwinia haradaeae]